MNSDVFHIEAPVQPPTVQFRTRIIVLLLIVCLGSMSVLGTFYDGLRRGMDHVAMFGPENEQAAITIALSEVVYNLDQGYVGYKAVLKKLTEVWNRGARNDGAPTLIDNGSNRELLNDAIGRAASLGPQQTGFVEDGSLITMLYTDIGQVDFTELAFRIFGLNIQSRYSMFFLLIGTTSVMYLLVFWKSPLANIVLLGTIFAFFIELSTPIFTYNMPTFSSERHCSTLALIPLWYFVFLFIERKRASAITIFGTVVQLTVLLLAIRIRGSAIWTLFFLCTVSSIFSVARWRRLGLETRTWKRLLKMAVTWPLVVLAAGWVISNEYTKFKLHPVYFTDDVIPYHGLWASAFAGILTMSPELLPHESKALEIAKTKSIDAAVAAASLEYLNETHFIRLPADYPQFINFPHSLVSPWTETYKFRLMDNVVKGVVMRTLAQHPLGAAKLYFYIKPQFISGELRKLLTAAPSLKWLWLLIGGGFIIALLGWIGSSNTTGLQLSYVVFICGLAIPFSALPNLWAWPTSYSIADLLLVAFVFTEIAIGAGAVFVLRLFLHRQDVSRWLTQLVKSLSSNRKSMAVEPSEGG